jgi:PBSX family phage terminase large subunit
MPRPNKTNQKKHRLSAAQKIFFLSLLADGLTSAEINKAAARYHPPFKISDAACTYYRKKMSIKHAQLAQQSELEGWSEGLAKKEERIKVLKALAARLIRDLLHDEPDKEKVWLDNIKGLGSGPQFLTFDYKDFNHQEFIQLRGLLEDIAKEQGARSTRIDMTTNATTTEAPVRIPADMLAPDFVNDYRDIKAKRHTEYVEFGGRGSTKSSFISLICIELIQTYPEIHMVGLRQVANTMRDSIYAQLRWAIEELGQADKWKCTTSPLEMEYLPTHQKIYFRGADDAGKIKSIKPAFGYIAILWFEELDQFHGPEAVRKIEQSAIRGGDLAWIFKSFNPPRTSGNWVNKYVQIPKESQYQHKSDYTTVPKEWLGQVFLDEAEHLKLVNPSAFDHEYMGVVNGAGGQVFENVQIRAITPAEIAQFDRILPGIDWGFYPDPFAFVKTYFNAAKRTLYIFDEYKAQKMGNKDVYEALIKKKKFSVQDMVIADSAEPKSVADFRDYGASIRGAEKGPESVKYSMKWLQSLNAIVIDNVRCPESAQEFLDYELEQDKDGNYISSYPDANNHFIDATRYATNLIWKRRGQ